MSGAVAGRQAFVGRGLPGEDNYGLVDSLAPGVGIYEDGLSEGCLRRRRAQRVPIIQLGEEGKGGEKGEKGGGG